MRTTTVADIGRTTRCFRGRWRIFVLDDETFVYDQTAERFLKVREEFAEWLLTDPEIEGQAVASLLGVAAKDG